jgi:hypothetical protein
MRRNPPNLLMPQCANYFRQINQSYSNCRVCKSFPGLHRLYFSEQKRGKPTSNRKWNCGLGSAPSQAGNPPGSRGFIPETSASIKEQEQMKKATLVLLSLDLAPTHPTLSAVAQPEACLFFCPSSLCMAGSGFA